MEYNLKKEMLKYAPELTREYKEFVESIFKKMQDELGLALDRVYDSHWSASFRGIRQNLKHTSEHVLVIGQNNPYFIDKVALARNAKRYGEDTALQWFYKMQGKLGELDNLSVTPPDNTGYVTINGTYQGNFVRIEQQRIINQSSRGLLFHQFPSRIYVNDKAQSELQYKKILRKWNVPHLEKAVVVTQYKCGKCGHIGPHSDFKDGGRSGIRVLGKLCPKCRSVNISKIEDPNKKPKIDPLTRPLRFSFDFKKEFVDNQYNHGRIDKENDSVSASNEIEAMEKIIKKEMSYGGYKQIFDFDLKRVWSWNNTTLWKKGDTKPVPVSSFKSKSQLKREAKK